MTINGVFNMEDMSTLGAQLIDLCKNGVNEVILASPFIKVDVMEHIIQAIGDGVQLYCFTRWRPDEIATGVSDLDIWLLVKNRRNSFLRLCSNLHAKYYRSDDKCLIGSANLTASGLGWSKQPNLELLVPVSPIGSDLAKFEKHLFRNSIEVDQSLYVQMVESVKIFSQIQLTSRPNVVAEQVTKDAIIGMSEGPKFWLPSLRNPEELFVAYSGHLNQLTTAGRVAAEADLAALAITPGLPQGVFERYVGIMLLQQPVIRQVDLFVQTPKRFGAVRDLIASICGNEPNFDADRAWQTLARWLRYFLPNRYGLSTPHYSEVFYRRF